jgi:hypothetical protein
MSTPRHELLALRIRAVYTENPDLKATFGDVCALVGGDEATCAAALDLLVIEAFLVRRHDGTFERVRSDLGNPL